MSGNCKDCRYWKRHIDTRNKKWNECSAANWVNYDAPIGESAIAFYADASDDSGLAAGIRTGPMFGCVKFQQRGSKC